MLTENLLQYWVVDHLNPIRYNTFIVKFIHMKFNIYIYTYVQYTCMHTYTYVCIRTYINMYACIMKYISMYFNTVVGVDTIMVSFLMMKGSY